MLIQGSVTFLNCRGETFNFAAIGTDSIIGIMKFYQYLE